MLSTRWDSSLWNELDRFQREVNRLFGRAATGVSNWPILGGAFPPVNIWEDQDNVYAEAELPGMKQEDLEVNVLEGNQLTIQGERKACDAGQGTWHRQERGFGKFSRALTLPAPINADKVEAKFEHGVLHLKLPKAEAAKPRRIVVKGV